jgi:hypothetical protein
MGQDDDLKLSIRESVYNLVTEERQYQNRKFGTSNPHEVCEWLALMQAHLNRAQEACVGTEDNRGALDELRKIIAIGMACAEEHGMPSRTIEG